MKKDLMNNEKINVVKLEDLNTEDRAVYQSFFTALIKLGRDTKMILKHAPHLTLSEYPHLVLKNRKGTYSSIYYSIDNNSWIIQKIPGIKEKFNPTAITGIIEFLSDYENGAINFSIEAVESNIRYLLRTYVNK